MDLKKKRGYKHFVDSGCYKSCKERRMFKLGEHQPLLPLQQPFDNEFLALIFPIPLDAIIWRKPVAIMFRVNNSSIIFFFFSALMLDASTHNFSVPFMLA
jgi:hypothetical protein